MRPSSASALSLFLTNLLWPPFKFLTFPLSLVAELFLESAKGVRVCGPCLERYNDWRTSRATLAAMAAAPKEVLFLEYVKLADMRDALANSVREFGERVDAAARHRAGADPKASLMDSIFHSH